MSILEVQSLIVCLYFLNKQEEKMGYYEDVYLKRLNHYGVDFQSRIQGQREENFRRQLAKSVYYVEFEYEAAGEVIVDSQFDFTEQLTDFDLDNEIASTIDRLSITEKIDEKKNFYRNIRRRAFRYMKILFKKSLTQKSI